MVLCSSCQLLPWRHPVCAVLPPVASLLCPHLPSKATLSARRMSPWIVTDMPSQAGSPHTSLSFDIVLRVWVWVRVRRVEAGQGRAGQGAAVVRVCVQGQGKQQSGDRQASVARTNAGGLLVSSRGSPERGWCFLRWTQAALLCAWPVEPAAGAAAAVPAANEPSVLHPRQLLVVIKSHASCDYHRV